MTQAAAIMLTYLWQEGGVHGLRLDIVDLQGEIRISTASDLKGKLQHELYDITPSVLIHVPAEAFVGSTLDVLHLRPHSFGAELRVGCKGRVRCLPRNSWIVGPKETADRFWDSASRVLYQHVDQTVHDRRRLSCG